MKKGFTLLELIVVIVILGILATLGFSQYTRMVEYMRAAECKATLSTMRQLAWSYYLANGTFANIQNGDLNLGTNGIPTSCTSTNYFSYSIEYGNSSPTHLRFSGVRCTSGGKPPQGQDAYPNQWALDMYTDGSTNQTTCWCGHYCNSGW